MNTIGFAQRVDDYQNGGNEYENRIKAIEDLNLATALQNITDRLTALESAMQNHTHETLAGTTSAGTTEQSR